MYFLFCLILAAELLLAVDIVSVFNGTVLNIGVSIAVAAAAVIIVYIFKLFSRKTCIILAAVIAGAFILTFTACVGTWKLFSLNAQYKDTDNGKEEFFGKSVMVFVPHEDDDLCVFGGMAEEFLKYGSDVHIVFATNGDVNGYERGLTRIGEAVSGQRELGVPEDRLIFLGYGDGTLMSIYRSTDNETVSSCAGQTCTYGTDNHPAYNNGNPYNREALLSDIKSVILEYRPEIIICSDLDYHDDHIALSFFFEEAVGDILRECADYKPIVLKGFSYYTAYYGAEDFYNAINVTASTGAEGINSVQPSYNMDNVLRVPVGAGCLSRSLYCSDEYRALNRHATQKAEDHALSIINADRLYWQRRTDSLCAQSVLSAASGDVSVLNDFKLIESSNGGVWSPTGEDKSLTVVFPEKTHIKRVALYDFCDSALNVLDAEIRFDTGESFKTGPLNEDGAANVFDIDIKNAESMTLTILKSSGAGAGISELEVFENAEQHLPRFMKLADTEGNFAYDYLCDGTAEFELYSSAADITLEECQIESVCVNSSVELNDGVLAVHCPDRNSECTVTVTAPDGSLSDTVRISRVSKLTHAGASLEKYFYFNWKQLQNTISYRMIRDVYHMLGGRNIVL